MRLGDSEGAIRKLEEAIVSHDEALKLANNKGRKEWNNKSIALQVLGEILMNIRNIEEAAKKNGRGC